MVREVLNEPPVEVGESQKGLHLLLVLWFGPFCYANYLCRVHLGHSM